MPPPDDLRYTAEHEWVRREPDGRLTVGITDYAANALGDIVFVSLPDRGLAMAQGQTFGEVESTKSVSEVYLPVAGLIVERNQSLETQPDLVNTDPYGEGWLVQIEPSEAAAYDELMDATTYSGLLS